MTTNKEQRNKLDPEVSTITIRNCPNGLKAKLADKARSEGLRLTGRKMTLGAFIIKILTDYVRASA